MDLTPAMQLKRVGVVAPCEAITDFPLYFEGDDASSLLAAWTAAWRPALLACAERLPEVVSAYEPPPDRWADGLLLVPGPGATGDAIEWLGMVRAARRLVEGFVDRPALISAIDAALPDLPKVSPEHEAEMFALGYAYLQVATLTYEVQYAAVFDPTLFEASVVKAARAAVEGDDEGFESAIAGCYDQLLQARSHSYPVDISLIDVALTSEGTLGQAFVDELNEASPLNVLLPASHAVAMASVAPASMAALRSAVAEGRASILTGDYDGDDLSAVAPEAMIDSIERGQSTIAGYTGAKPRVFAQRATAFGPRLPRALTELGFQGALLVGFDGGAPPMSEFGKTTWVGVDGVSLEAAVAVPRDLARPETLLRLSELLSETLQRDHAATVLLAGYPGARNAHLDDLRRVARRSEVLGRLVTLEAYFQSVGPVDHWGHFDQNAMGPSVNRFAPVTDLGGIASHRDQLGESLLRLAQSTAGRRPEGSVDGALNGVARLITASGESPTRPRRLVVNPWSFPAAGVEQVPAMGFVVESDQSSESPPPRAEGLVIRNERLEAKVHEATGGLRSIRTHASRRNQASQRLLLTRRRSTSPLTQMHAESVEIVEKSSTAGAVQSRGVLLDGRGRRFAEYEQTIRLARNADWLDFQLRAEATDALPGGVEGFALVFRLALGDANLAWRRGLQWASLPVTRSAFVAGEYAAAGDASREIALACERPLQMRRVAGGQLDAVVPWDAEGVAAARFALAIEGRRPMHACLGGLGGVIAGEVQLPESSPAAGWWAHVSAAGVLVSRIDAPAGESRARLRLIETEGRAATLKLRLCRPIREASLQSFSGENREALPIAEGVAEIEIGPYGWLQVEVSW